MSVFTPTERAILGDYFGADRPHELIGINVEDEPESGIYVDESGGYYVADETPLHKAVARIALSVIQERLPQTGIVDSQDNVTLTRKAFEKPSRDIVPLPQHLLTINWADSGPGISWPETYHVTYIPEFDRYVVTAAMDSPDMYGVTEMAIGHFSPSDTVRDGSLTVIRKWWKFLQASNQQRFAYVWGAGLVAADEVDDIADSVWGSSISEIPEYIRIIQSEHEDIDDVSEALRMLVLLIIDDEGSVSEREKSFAFEALGACLDETETPRKNLLEVVDYVRQLGRNGRCFVSQLMALLEEGLSRRDQEMSEAVIAALTSSLPTDEIVHDRMVGILMDSYQPTQVRYEAADFLLAITGIGTYQNIKAALRKLAGVSIPCRSAPHDSSIYTGKNRPPPSPTAQQKMAANRCRAILGDGQETESA